MQVSTAYSHQYRLYHIANPYFLHVLHKAFRYKGYYRLAQFIQVH